MWITIQEIDGFYGQCSQGLQIMLKMQLAVMPSYRYPISIFISMTEARRLRLSDGMRCVVSLGALGLRRAQPWLRPHSGGVHQSD